MRTSRRAISLLTAPTIVLALACVGTAAASQMDTLTYAVGNLPSGRQAQIYYTSGVNTANGGVLTVRSGSVLTMGLTTNSMYLRALQGPLNANVYQFVEVGSGSIAGTAAFPPGATVSLTDGLTNKTYKLTNGAFVIPTRVGSGSKPPRSGTQTVRCHGGAHACEATVSIAGGASNRKLVIGLSDTNFRLTSVTASPKSSQRAYTLSRGHYALGGSEYIVTLDALKSNPMGAHLVLKFAA